MQFEPTEDYLKQQGLSNRLPDRFYKQIDKNGPIPKHVPHLGPCWPWTGYTTGKEGYGATGNGAAKHIKAHRAAWLLFRGPIPFGHVVMHKCDNPICVNPNHLKTGTDLDNCTDKESKNRANHPAKEGHPNAILNEKQVLEIRRLYGSGMKQSEIAHMFGTCQTNVSCIVRRQGWK